jgi:hypothetical protein
MVTENMDCWVKERILFIQSYNLDLQPHIETLLLCNNDEYMMAYWTTPGGTSHQLERLIRFRLYLQVFNIYEVVSVDGKSLLRNYYEGEKGIGSQHYQWPNQNLPSLSDWSIWKE